MLPEVSYVVYWHWREPDWITRVDIVKASDAQRAINEVKRQLRKEYSDVNRLFAPIEVKLYDLQKFGHGLKGLGG